MDAVLNKRKWPIYDVKTIQNPELICLFFHFDKSINKYVSLFFFTLFKVVYTRDCYNLLFPIFSLYCLCLYMVRRYFTKINNIKKMDLCSSMKFNDCDHISFCFNLKSIILRFFCPFDYYIVLLMVVQLMYHFLPFFSCFSISVWSWMMHFLDQNWCQSMLYESKRKIWVNALQIIL